ncbi:MAG: type VI secretion system tube protein TssD [Nannocystaceae bacterium]|nr:type VI secretion system tube protein Hcp [Myxococcales bacterium]
MAQTVHAHLTANGKAVEGESTITTLGREGSIECVEFEDRSVVEVNQATGRPLGQRQHQPLRIVKRIDQSSPILAQAMCKNEVIAGSFDFYRPHPEGDGTEQKFFTVEVEGGYITEIRRHSPDCSNPAQTRAEPSEEVRLTYHTITWTFHEGGKTYTDNWRESGVG